MKNRTRNLALILLLACLLLATAPPAGAQSPVVPHFTYTPSEPVAGDNITFDARGSTGSNLSFRWDFGDGSWAAGPVVVHVYNASGWYDVALEASDGKGNWAVYKERVYVSPEDEVSLVEALLILLLAVVLLVAAALGLTLLIVVAIFFLVFWFTALVLALVFIPLMRSKARREGYGRMASKYTAAMVVLLVLGFFIPPFCLLAIVMIIILFVMFHFTLSSKKTRDKYGKRAKGAEGAPPQGKKKGKRAGRKKKKEPS